MPLFGDSDLEPRPTPCSIPPGWFDLAQHFQHHVGAPVHRTIRGVSQCVCYERPPGTQNGNPVITLVPITQVQTGENISGTAIRKTAGERRLFRQRRGRTTSDMPHLLIKQA